MVYALKAYLPVRFIPLPDELFTSWIVRLARENGTKLHTFSSLLFSEKRIWSRDLDKSADDRHLAVMEETTGFSAGLIKETFLRSFEGKFYETHNPNGNSAWLMPVGVYHQTRRNYGLQMCPACLRGDGENGYYRKLWRVSWVTVCEKHKTILLDRCPNCVAPIVFHRGEMGYRNLYSNYSNVQCPKCDFYWTSNKAIDASISASPEIIRFQLQLRESMDDGWTKINGYGVVHSIPFFNGLKQILKLLSVSKQGRKFREATSLKSGLPFNEPAENFHTFDLLPVEMRYEALGLADWLLFDWATRFVELAEASHCWSSTLLSGCVNIPFWYWSTVHDFLTKQTHYTTETEIFAALNYLKRNFDLILPSHLEKLIGKPYLFEKRSGFFIASIYDQLKKHNDNKERQRLKCVEESAKQINAEFSKTKAKKAYRSFKKEHIQPARSFRRIQAMLIRLVNTHRISERLKMVKDMERIQNATTVATRYGVTYPVVLKWYRRFSENGIEGLGDRSRCPKSFRHQIVFDREERWIREIHSEGLDLVEIQQQLQKRHNFTITEGGLYRVLNRLKLKLHNSKKQKRNNKLPRFSLPKFIYRPNKKIFIEQEQWILELHAKGLNNNQIKKNLHKTYGFDIGITAIRSTLFKYNLSSHQSRRLKKR
jgi:transposase